MLTLMGARFAARLDGVLRLYEDTVVCCRVATATAASATATCRRSRRTWVRRWRQRVPMWYGTRLDSRPTRLPRVCGVTCGFDGRQDLKVTAGISTPPIPTHTPETTSVTGGVGHEQTRFYEDWVVVHVANGQVDPDGLVKASRTATSTTACTSTAERPCRQNAARHGKTRLKRAIRRSHRSQRM
jgi:hypothetical protein